MYNMYYNLERYAKDEKLTGIYVKRCKCGARPYSDEVAIGSRPTWIACKAFIRHLNQIFIALCGLVVDIEHV